MAGELLPRDAPSRLRAEANGDTLHTVPVSPFRKEAIDAHLGRGTGRPIAAMPISWRWIAALLVAMVVTVGAFVTTQTYSRKETVRGVLRPSAGETRVLAARPGTVSALHVSEGSIVQSGDLLATIATVTTASGGIRVEHQVLAELDQEEAALTASLQALDEGRGLDDAGANARHRTIEAQLQSTETALQLAEQRKVIAQERVDAVAPLEARGFISRDEMARRRLTVMDIEQQVLDLRGVQARLRGDLAANRIEIARNPLNAQRSRSEIETRLADLRQRRANAEGAQGYEIRALVAGRVSAIQAQTGQPVEQSRPFLTLTPEHADLVADLYVPSRGIGFIQPGQRVRLLYDAFPFQRFGAGKGVVQSVSATSLTPNEIRASVEINEPVYRVVVRLDQQTMQAYHTSTRLQAGMALTADIVLEERSFAEWLLEPVLAMRGRL